MGIWLFVALAVLAIIGAFAFWAARGRSSASAPGERELSPREELARDGGMASFGLNPPWWLRPDEYRRRAAGRRK